MAGKTGPDSAGNSERTQIFNVRLLNAVIGKQASQYAHVKFGIVGNKKVVADKEFNFRPNVCKVGGIGHISWPDSVDFNVAGPKGVKPARGLDQGIETVQDVAVAVKAGKPYAAGALRKLIGCLKIYCYKIHRPSFVRYLVLYKAPGNFRNVKSDVIDNFKD